MIFVYICYLLFGRKACNLLKNCGRQSWAGEPRGVLPQPQNVLSFTGKTPELTESFDHYHILSPLSNLTPCKTRNTCNRMWSHTALLSVLANRPVLGVLGSDKGRAWPQNRPADYRDKFYLATKIRGWVKPSTRPDCPREGFGKCSSWSQFCSWCSHWCWHSKCILRIIIYNFGPAFLETSMIQSAQTPPNKDGINI